MKTREPVAASPPSASDPIPDGWRRHVRPLLTVCLVATVVAGFYFLLYPVKRYPNPIGWDAPKYLLQTSIVAEHGLQGVPTALPPPGKTLTSRAAFPVLSLTLSSLFSVSTFKLAETLPIAGAVATALAAAAFVSVALRRRTWEFAVVGFLVGVSPVLIRLMAPETYADNLFLMAILAAAQVPTLIAARDGSGFVPAVLLLGAAALAHSTFFASGMIVLVLVTALLIPESVRAHRDGAALSATPSGRLAAVLGGAAALAAALMFGVLRRPPDTPRLSHGELLKKLRQDTGLYVFPVTLPLAAAGGATLATRGRRRGRQPYDTGREAFGARFLLLLLCAWSAVVLAALVAFRLGANIPAHRFLASFLALPIAVAVGVLGLGAWLGRRVRSAKAGRRATAAVVGAAVIGFGALAVWEYYVDLPANRGVEWLEFHKVQDTANAAAYLDAVDVPADTPVVFVVDDPGNNPLSNIPELAYIVRSALPADRILHSWFYAGNPDTYLAGKPTLRARPATYNAISKSFWRPLRRLLDRPATRPVALLLNHVTPFYERIKARHPDWEVAPGVIVLEGPRPATPLGYAPAPWGLRTVPEGVAVSVGTLAVLALIGLGWAVALLPAGLRSFEVLALALSFGLAAVILAGVAMDVLGVRLAGVGGTLTLALAAGAGWLAAVVRLRHRAGAGLFPADWEPDEPQPQR